MSKNTPTAIALADDGRSATISLRGIVGVSWDATSREVAWLLDQHKDVEDITVYINSLGGLAHEGISIHNQLRGHPARIHVVVEGVAGSAASIVAMAGDDIAMYANALMMIHGVRVVEEDDWGNEVDTPEAREAARAFNAAMVETYMARTGKTEDEVRALLATDTWMTAREALAAGFADNVIELHPSAEDPATATAASPLVAIAAALDIPADVLARAQAEAAGQGAAPAANPEASEGGDPQPAPASPEADPAPANAEASATFAAQINALAVAHGLGDHVAAWLLDGGITTTAQAEAAIKEAREVRDLCAFANAADRATGFIRARKSLAEVRAELINAQADAADQQHTDGHHQSTSAGQVKPRGSKPAVSIASIYSTLNSTARH